MKKGLVLILSVMLIATLLFSGCSEDNSPAASASTPVPSQNTGPAQSADNTPVPGDSRAEQDNTTNNASAQQITDSTRSTVDIPSPEIVNTDVMNNYHVSEYEDQIVALMEKMDSADISAYKSLKSEARQISDAMDRTEDLAEIDYYNGKISNADYIQVERELEVLEEMLDHAEDSMEFRLGIDD